MNDQLQNELLELDWDNFNSIIDLYERNLIYFKNFNEKEDLAAIEEITYIKLSYILALDKKKHYTKANNCLKEVAALISRLKGSEYYDQTNEKYLYACGVIAQRFDKYEESQSYFSQLVKIDPDNHMYKTWYDSNQEWSLYNQIKFVGYIGMGLFFINLFARIFDLYRHDLFLKLDFLAFFLILLGFWGYKPIKYFKKLWKNEI